MRLSRRKGLIIHNDCIKAMAEMEANSIDAIVTDAPYGLEFMGKGWDKGVPGIPYWKEAYRVLKPGGSMLVMGGTRTFHRLMVAIEDTRFILKDTLMWMYGSGFPKAQDLGKLIDKKAGEEREVIDTYKIPDGRDYTKEKSSQQGYNKTDLSMGKEKGNERRYITAPTSNLAKYWDGWKVGGIKPAYEPIVWAVKPPEGSYTDNILKWGVGGVNVDECRIGIDIENDPNLRINPVKRGVQSSITFQSIAEKRYEVPRTFNHQGRFPANVILDEEAGRLLDEQSGVLKSGSGIKNPKNGKKSIFRVSVQDEGYYSHSSSGGASRFFYCAKASKSERDAGLEGMEKEYSQTFTSDICKDNREGRDEHKRPQIKASNFHPTVKPIALFKYLIKLVTRKGQTILDPFMGSGTTGCACAEVEREFIGIEKEDEYIEIAKRRIGYWEGKSRQLEIEGARAIG